jgi:hypothetical protein
MDKKVIFTVVLVIICLSSLAFGAVSFGLVDLPQKLQKLDVKTKKEIQAVKAEKDKLKELAKKEEQKKKEELAKKKEQEKKKELQAKEKEKSNKEKSNKEKQIKLGKPIGPMAAWLISDSDKEKGIQHKLTEKSKQVAGVWATLKAVNGVINVLQSIQLGGSVIVEASVSPMEFLSPIDNILDRISDLLLLAFSAIVFEKILLAISGYIVFLIIIPVCAIISIVSIWTSNDKSKISKVVIVSVLINLIVMFAIPVSFYLSSFIEKTVLNNNMNKVLSSIDAKGNTAAKMEKELTGLRKIGTSVSTYLTNAKNLSSAVIEDMINYFIIFIFTSIIIPILTIFGLYFLAKYCAKLILRQN